ncbi:hypothetical protein D3C74_277290 [compost metagenome]
MINRLNRDEVGVFILIVFFHPRHVLEEVRIDFFVRQRVVRLNIVGQHDDLQVDAFLFELRFNEFKDVGHRRNQRRNL